MSKNARAVTDLLARVARGDTDALESLLDEADKEELQAVRALEKLEESVTREESRGGGKKTGVHFEGANVDNIIQKLRSVSTEDADDVGANYAPTEPLSPHLDKDKREVRTRLYPDLHIAAGDMTKFRPKSKGYEHEGKRKHEMSWHAVEDTQAASKEAAVWELSLRDNLVTEEEHVAFARHSHASDTTQKAVKLSKKKLRQLHNKLRAAAYTGPDNGCDLEVLFKRIDKNNDGLLSKAEFFVGLRRLLPMSKQELEYVYNMIDVNHDGSLCIEEFLQFLKTIVLPPKNRLAKDKAHSDTYARSYNELSGHGKIAATPPARSVNFSNRNEPSRPARKWVTKGGKRKTPTKKKSNRSTKRSPITRRRPRDVYKENLSERFHVDFGKLVGGDMTKLRPQSKEEAHRGPRKHEVSMHVVRTTQSMSRDARIWEGSLRDTVVTENERMAFRSHSDAKSYHRHARVKHEKIKVLRSKLRACTYVGIKGRDMRVALKRMDKDRNGVLSKEELANGLKRLLPLSDQEIRCLWNMIDVDHDGNVDIDEFMRFIEGGADRGPAVSLFVYYGLQGDTHRPTYLSIVELKNMLTDCGILRHEKFANVKKARSDSTSSFRTRATDDEEDLSPRSMRRRGHMPFNVFSPRTPQYMMPTVNWEREHTDYGGFTAAEKVNRWTRTLCHRKRMGAPSSPWVPAPGINDATASFSTHHFHQDPTRSRRKVRSTLRFTSKKKAKATDASSAYANDDAESAAVDDSKKKEEAASEETKKAVVGNGDKTSPAELPHLSTTEFGIIWKQALRWRDGLKGPRGAFGLRKREDLCFIDFLWILQKIADTLDFEHLTKGDMADVDPSQIASALRVLTLTSVVNRAKRWSPMPCASSLARESVKSSAVMKRYRKSFHDIFRYHSLTAKEKRFDNRMVTPAKTLRELERHKEAKRHSRVVGIDDSGVEYIRKRAETKPVSVRKRADKSKEHLLTLEQFMAFASVMDFSKGEFSTNQITERQLVSIFMSSYEDSAAAVARCMESRRPHGITFDEFLFAVSQIATVIFDGTYTAVAKSEKSARATLDPEIADKDTKLLCGFFHMGNVLHLKHDELSKGKFTKPYMEDEYRRTTAKRFMSLFNADYNAGKYARLFTSSVSSRGSKSAVRDRGTPRKGRGQLAVGDLFVFL
eukprot:g1639.t1